MSLAHSVILATQSDNIWNDNTTVAGNPEYIFLKMSDEVNTQK